jgi:hypothetical protein
VGRLSPPGPQPVPSKSRRAPGFLGALPHGVDGLRQALEPVADRDAHVFHAPVLDLGQHGEPELRPFSAVPGPQPEDVAFAVDADADASVGRLDHVRSRRPNTGLSVTYFAGTAPTDVTAGWGVLDGVGVPAPAGAVCFWLGVG